MGRIDRSRIVAGAGGPVRARLSSRGAGSGGLDGLNVGFRLADDADDLPFDAQQPHRVAPRFSREPKADAHIAQGAKTSGCLEESMDRGRERSGKGLES
jgi:hypothetical protein